MNDFENHNNPVSLTTPEVLSLPFHEHINL